MGKFNKSKSKILVRMKISSDSDEYKYIYLPYPRMSWNSVNRVKKKKELATKYGYEDYREFWNEIIEIARDDNYSSVWKFIEDKKLDEYFYSNDTSKNTPKDSKINHDIAKSISNEIINTSIESIENQTIDIKKKIFDFS